MLAFWLLLACLSCYIAGMKRRSAVDEAMMRLESRCLTAEYCLAQSTAEAANWRAAFVEAEAVIDESKERLAKLAWSHREQVVLNGDLHRRVYDIGASQN